MNLMSTGYLESGRARQKQRTRDQLIAAARELITTGDTPRIEDAAEAAGISRTTAYRYFTSQTELLAAAYPETTLSTALPDPPPSGVKSASRSSRTSSSTWSGRRSCSSVRCCACRWARLRMTCH